ncbi:MAG TPA: hypothetical protein ENF16_06195, partial [Bacteroidetes bacterium]|nr:hypothetical protein [Bacteroidota bacterium]
MAAKRMTQEYLIQLFLDKGLLSEAQVARIKESYKIQRKKLMRKLRRERSDGQGRHEDITAVDVLASYGLPIAGREEKILTEDLIMKVAAEDMGLPFRKIDPLDLDLDVVTKTLPRSFALKHLVVPIQIVNNTLEVAIYDPFDHAVLEDVKRVSEY